MYEKQLRRLDELREEYELLESRYKAQENEEDLEEMARIYEEIREIKADLNSEIF